MGQVRFYCKSCFTMQNYFGGSVCCGCAEKEDASPKPYRGPSIFVRGGRGDAGDLDYDPVHLGGNVADGYRTPAQQEAVYKKQYLTEQKQAAEIAAQRKGTRRSDSEWRKVATIPREAFEAEKHVQDNMSAWQDGGKELLKGKGWLYDHEDA